ncbi:MAG: protein kinase [Proteobacteria bacterium]|nr:protein kinase [Pseudomonadota bacterium]
MSSTEYGQKDNRDAEKGQRSNNELGSMEAVRGEYEKSEQYEKIGEGLGSEKTDKDLSAGFAEQVLEKYEILEKIGQGTQGSVFRARRKSDDVIVAIKQLPIGSVTTWKEYELFQREVAVLSELNLDGVAKFYEAIECLEGERPAAYVVQEFIEGRTLDVMMKSGYRFSLTRSFELILQLIDILEQLHHHDPPIIHRDIKPSNIIMRPAQGDGFDLFLIDFGAVANPQVQSGGSTVAGTYGYMPPEQLMGRPTVESDIYALGALCVHLLTGLAPVDLPIKDFHLVFEPYMQNMPVSVVNTIRAMLDPSIEKRLCDYDKLRFIFDAFYHSKFDIEGTNAVIEYQEKAGFFKRMRMYPEKAKQRREYNKRVRAVHHLCQAGNLEVWQRLPEQTPRPLPCCNKRLIFNDHIQFRQDLIEQGDMFAYFKASVFKSKGIPVALIGLGILTLISLFMGSFAAMFWFSPLVVMAVAFVSLMVEDSKRLVNIQGMLTKWGSDRRPVYDLNDKDILDLIQKGRKTIATITQIEFIESNPGEVEAITFNTGAVRQLVYAGAPRIRIRYKFNPPDDSNPNDLIHQVVVHRLPPDNCKPGEPLPILYNIDRTSGDESVTSIPYPFPLDDICSAEELVSVSRSRVNWDVILSGKDNGSEIVDENGKPVHE